MRGERRRKIELHHDPALSQHAPQRGHETRVSGVGDRSDARAIIVVIADRHRLHLPQRVDHRLQQRAVKGEELAAVAGLAFGKDRNHIARFERGTGVAVDAMRVATAPALNEQRAAVGDQAADQRPARKIRPGDEARRLNRIEHEYVEPGNVVGDDQHVARQPAGRPSADPQLGFHPRRGVRRRARRAGTLHAEEAHADGG